MYQQNFSVPGYSPLGEAIDDAIRKSSQQYYSSPFAATKSSNSNNNNNNNNIAFYAQTDAYQATQVTNIFTPNHVNQELQQQKSTSDISMLTPIFNTPQRNINPSSNNSNNDVRAFSNKSGQKQPACHSTLVSPTRMEPSLSECSDISYKLSVQRQRAAMNRDRYRKVRFCVFCQSSKQPEYIYKSHVLKDTAGRVACPYLRSYICPQCGASGDDAHTIKYCPAMQPTLIFT